MRWNRSEKRVVRQRPDKGTAEGRAAEPRPDASAAWKRLWDEGVELGDSDAAWEQFLAGSNDDSASNWLLR